MPESEGARFVIDTERYGLIDGGAFIGEWVAVERDKRAWSGEGEGPDLKAELEGELGESGEYLHDGLNLILY